MRACIMRNFSPHRIEICTCQNFSVENDPAEIYPLNSRVGLIRTRKKLEDITKALREKKYKLGIKQRLVHLGALFYFIHRNKGLEKYFTLLLKRATSRSAEFSATSLR